MPGSPTAQLAESVRALVEQIAAAMLFQAHGVLQAELNALGDAVDALSDALMAETVYQVVRGNPLRAASTVESIAGGETPPPELEVVRTPRTGIALTHRLVTLFSGDPQLPPGWAPSSESFRANAEPHLNALGGETARQSGPGSLPSRAAGRGVRTGLAVERTASQRAGLGAAGFHLRG